MNTTTAVQYKLVEQPYFRAKIHYDLPNKRLKLTSFKAEDYDKLIQYLLLTAEQTASSKIWLICCAEQWIEFLSRGFVLEGIAEGYLNGQTGFFMSYFLTGSRRTSTRYEDDQKILQEILQMVPETETKFYAALPKDFIIKKAGNNDIEGLASLFSRVFETYPVPVSDSTYLLEAMNGSSIFYFVEHHSQIVSAASASIDQTLGNAEITDCATLAAYRGQKLIFSLIAALETDLRSRHINCLYSLARATSPGVSKVFRKMGYQYRGRLINNCDICANFEDMNLWVKYRPTGIYS